MAMIAGLPKAPSRFNPLANPVRAKERRDWILGRMYKLGKIDQASYQTALAEPLNASYHVPTPEVNAPYIAEMARAEMVGRYGSDAYTEASASPPRCLATCRTWPTRPFSKACLITTNATATVAPKHASRAAPRQPGCRSWASSASLAAWSRPSSPMSTNPASRY